MSTRHISILTSHFSINCIDIRVSVNVRTVSRSVHVQLQFQLSHPSVREAEIERSMDMTKNRVGNMHEVGADTDTDTDTGDDELVKMSGLNTTIESMLQPSHRAAPSSIYRASALGDCRCSIVTLH